MTVPLWWARSGAMWLTGHADGPPLPVAGAPADQLHEDLAAIGAAAPGAQLPGVALLGERAAVTGRTRAGRTSVGGSSRLLRAADGWIAVTLARAADLQVLPALISAPVTDPWREVAAWVARTGTQVAVERAVLLELPAAVVASACPRRRGVIAYPAGESCGFRRGMRVLDLSALWAGPLCAHLLGLMGAEVVKVEHAGRPDGARFGPKPFYDLLHAGHAAVCLDFHSDSGRAALRALIAAADVVVDSARPRAWSRLGIDIPAVVKAGTSWVSITAYGRSGTHGQRVGFGDDVAAGAGLVAGPPDAPVFAGDALADPLAGVAAARAVIDTLHDGRCALLDVSMSDVAVEAYLRRPEWDAGSPAAPVRRRPFGRVAPIGADNTDVLARWLAS